MLGTDRIVEPPSEVGFEYSPTPLADGLRLAVERYDQAISTRGTKAR